MRERPNCYQRKYAGTKVDLFCNLYLNFVFGSQTTLIIFVVPGTYMKFVPGTRRASSSPVASWEYGEE